MKLQKRDNRRLFTRELYDSPYDNENSFGPTYGAHREALELDRGRATSSSQAWARELGLVFFATAFDEASADLLEELDIPAYKIASGDLRNTPLLRHVASFGKPHDRVHGGRDHRGRRPCGRRGHGRSTPRLCLLQCTARTRLRSRSSKLGVITTYRERYPELVVGLSDHQDGIAMAPVAYMLGARVIEKHFTLEPRREGHRPRVLADARRDAEARPRPAPRPRRDRRRRQAPAAERGGAAQEDGKEARRRPRRSPPGTCSPTVTSSQSRPRTAACRPTALDDLRGRPLVRPLAEDEAIRTDCVGDVADDVVSSGSAAAAT